MRLSDYLEPDLVMLDLHTTGVEDTLAAIVGRLRDARGIDDTDALVRALVEREATHSTSLGNGVALPHAAVPGVDRPVALIGVAPEGVDFGGASGDPVRLFFVLLSPLQAAGTHIKLLARVVRLVRRPGFLASLLEAETGEDLVGAVTRLDALQV